MFFNYVIDISDYITCDSTFLKHVFNVGIIPKYSKYWNDVGNVCLPRKTSRLKLSSLFYWKRGVEVYRFSVWIEVSFEKNEFDILYKE